MSIFHSKEQDGTLNVCAVGKVSREPEYKETNYGGKVKFSIAYGKKKYMDCEAWSDSTAGNVAGMLDKGDSVMVTGTLRKWDYNGKTYSSIDVDGIFPVGVASSVAAPSAEHDPDVPPLSQPNGSFSELMDDDDSELPF